MYCLTFTYISYKIIVDNYSAIGGNEVFSTLFNVPRHMSGYALTELLDDSIDFK